MVDEGVLAVSPLQRYGYVRCYRAIVGDCGVAAAFLYGVLENYAQLGERTGIGCVPSHATLAKDMGVHRNTIITQLQSLREKGWVEWEEHGKVNRYTLPNRIIRPAQKLGTMSTEFGQVTCTENVHYLTRTESNKTLATASPTPPNGAAESVWASEAEAAGKFSVMVGQFTAVSPLLDASWLRGAVASVEYQYPQLGGQPLTDIVKETLIKLEDALSRPNQIHSPRALGKKWLHDAAEEHLR